MSKNFKKLEKDFIILCENAFASADNKINLIGLFEEIKVDKFPTRHPQSFLVGVFEVDEEDDQDMVVTFELIDSKGKFPDFQVKPLELIKSPVNKRGTRRYGFVIQMVDLPLREEGIYKFVVFVNDIELGQCAFWAGLKQ